MKSQASQKRNRPQHLNRPKSMNNQPSWKSKNWTLNHKPQSSQKSLLRQTHQVEMQLDICWQSIQLYFLAARIRDALNAAITKEDSDKELLNAISTKEAMMDLWNAADYNGNGGCSLAELDAMAVAKSFNVSKPTLMRAYKKTIHRDGDGDDWVEKKEFPAFIVNAFFFEKLWGVFEDLDADDDRRIGLDEFTRGLAKLGVALTTEEAQAEFDKIDNNDGGMVLFSEFCKYAQAAVGVCAGVGDDDAWQAGSKPKA
eukprot:TRINITY_DN9148_c1_g1_i2.p1 TRINITY_DN9148_c1_g1~~TRINITY_DN9148_c1_g1_i2.p1  ORF type:complete len:256 (+),score=72.08 TRINITY_DN9148_c1_g1_i2:222-989(+)